MGDFAGRSTRPDEAEAAVPPRRRRPAGELFGSPSRCGETRRDHPWFATNALFLAFSLALWTFCAAILALRWRHSSGGRDYEGVGSGARWDVAATGWWVLACVLWWVQVGNRWELGCCDTVRARWNHVEFVWGSLLVMWTTDLWGGGVLSVDVLGKSMAGILIVAARVAETWPVVSPEASLEDPADGVDGRGTEPPAPATLYTTMV